MPIEPGKQSKISAGVVVAIIAGGLSILCCLGTVAAIALPNFIHYNKRATTSEVKSNLKAAFSAERSYFMEKDAYSESAEQIGFQPERGNRYRYFLAPHGDMLIQGAPDGGAHSSVGADLKKDLLVGNAMLEAGVPSALLGSTGIKGTCPDCNITIVAAGNIDSDPTVDVWSISTEDRTIGGEKVPAGTPHCHVNDVN
jgi:type II secretory pathway pseudopilin PulG